MSYNSNLQSKNTKIQSLIDKANALPDKTAGVELPTLSNPAEISEIFLDKEVIGQNGQIKTGTFTLANELDTQDDLIAQIQVALQNKASASEPILQSKTVSPSTSSQVVKPDTGYDGLNQVTVNAMPTASQATPSITVNSSGLITASATQTAGYVSAGTKSATKQLTTKAAATITPTTTSQIAVSSGTYTTGNITVAAIPSDYIIPSGTLTITTNGTHNVKNYESATVNVTSTGGGSSEDTEILNGILSGNITSYSNNTATTVRGGLFMRCTKLTAVSFPAATKINQYAFYQCSSLTTISFPACVTVGENAFGFCSKVVNINLPVCTTVGMSAFGSCYKLLNLSLPQCTSVANYALARCSVIKTINLPACQTIGVSAFRENLKLTTVSIPAAKSIPAGTFSKCFNLKSLYLTGSVLCTLANSNAFASTPIGGYSASAKAYGSIYVPASMLASYQAATNWTYFSSRMVGI